MKYMLSRKSQSDGFSLIELIVVLLLISLLLSISIAALQTIQQKSTLSGEIIKITSFLSTQKATARNTLQKITLTFQSNKIQTTMNEDLKLLGTIKIIAKQKFLYFYPDGSTNGITLHITSNKTTRIVTVHPLSGAIEIQ